jgi:hypothetical protein
VIFLPKSDETFALLSSVPYYSSSEQVCTEIIKADNMKKNPAGINMKWCIY